MTTMAHLDDTQLLEAATGERDSEVDAAAARHLGGCRTCSDRVGELRSMIETVASVDVPEPSPLFWDHFPARVTRAIESAPEPTRWFSASRWLWGSAATAAVVMVLMLLPLRRDAVAPTEAPIITASSNTEAGGVDSPDELDRLEGDDAWEM